MSNYLREFYKEYQYEQEKKESFNEDLIYAKNKENIVQLISEVCRSLEILPEIKFISCSLNPINKIHKEGKNKNICIDIEESRLSKIEFKMEIKMDNGDKCEIKKSLLFPDLLENNYFLINGTKRFPVFQLVDAECYKTKNSITLRTLLMRLVLIYKNVVLKDKHELINYNTKNIKFFLFKFKIPVFQYYFSKMGVNETIEYFNLPFELNEAKNADEYIDYNYEFAVNKNISLFVDKEWFDSNIKQNSILVVSFIESLEGRLSFERINSKEFWIKKLGGYFTSNNSNLYDKGISILNSFERIFDETTKRVIRVNEEDKKDVYAICRWMILNYNDLLKQDNNDLANKRLRLYEYLLYPLVDKFSKSIYRILNQKKVSIENYKQIFSNIPEGFLIKGIINNNLVRYLDTVNTIDLFTNVLKGSITGPQTSEGISDEMTRIHPSMVGKIDTCATSTGDPGKSFTLCPFCQLKNGLYFTEEPNLLPNNE